MPSLTDMIAKGLRKTEAYWSRGDVAAILGVSPPRVSQIAKELNIKVKLRGYKDSDVAKMKQRNTKPGPKTGARAK